MDLTRASTDPAYFRQSLCIDVAGQTVRLGDVLTDWQAADFAATDAALMRVAGRLPDGAAVPHSKAWKERCRGASKTLDAAIDFCWLLAFSRRPIVVIVAAGDLDQARLSRDAANRLLRFNPKLGELLNVNNYRISNPHTGAELEIISSDSGTSFGHTPDAVYVDELGHWPERGRALWDSLISSSAKKPGCLLSVTLNAGWKDSWQWEVREAVRTDPAWYFSALTTPPSWISSESLEQQRRLLTAESYRRLWEGEWSSGAGDALSGEDIDAAVDSRLMSMTGGERGFAYTAGLDIGIKRDRTGFAVLATDGRTGRIRLAHVESWQPGLNREVDLDSVERGVVAAARRFRRLQVHYDPHQAEHLAQRLRRFGVSMVPMPFSGPNLHRMASTVMQLFRERRIDLYPHTELIGDLRSLRIEERPGFGGYRLTAPRTAVGHCDLGIAFSIAAPGASVAAASAGSSFRSPPQGFSRRNEMSHARPAMPVPPTFFA